MNLIRKCPTCNTDINYSKLINYNRANKNNCSCKSCASSIRMSNPNTRKSISNKLSGENNPFFNKKHSEHTKNIIRNKSRENSHGNKNPMYGKRVFDIWVEKYGIEEANKRNIEWKRKQSLKSKGKNNGMYGKPSPKGSGNGWSGWYKGWFFRSLMELTYMIDVIEKNNLYWECGENGKHIIIYEDYKGICRTYRPDFIINTNKMIEIKPIKLWNSDNVKRKKIAAEQYCSRCEMTYELINVENIISIDRISELINNNLLIFTDRYMKKFNIWQKSHISYLEG